MFGRPDIIDYKMMVLGVAGNILTLLKLDLEYHAIFLELKLLILSMLIIKLTLMIDKLD